MGGYQSFHFTYNQTIKIIPRILPVLFRLCDCQFGHPIAAQLEWSPRYVLRGINDPSVTNCSWKLEMLVQEGTHLDMTDSINPIEDAGVSITLRTDYASHAFNISYTRRVKKTAESKNFMHCFHGRCYTGFDSSYTNVSWQKAHDHCQSSGHHLLSINSETEWLRLAQLFFYESSETHRCTGLMIIFLGLKNQMVGITYCNITMLRFAPGRLKNHSLDVYVFIRLRL